MKNKLVMEQEKKYVKPSVTCTEVLTNKVLCVSSIEFGGTIDYLDSPESRDNINWDEF